MLSSSQLSPIRNYWYFHSILFPTYRLRNLCIFLIRANRIPTENTVAYLTRVSTKREEEHAILLVRYNHPSAMPIKIIFFFFLAGKQTLMPRLERREAKKKKGVWGGLKLLTFLGDYVLYVGERNSYCTPLCLTYRWNGDVVMNDLNKVNLIHGLGIVE